MNLLIRAREGAGRWLLARVALNARSADARQWAFDATLNSLKRESLKVPRYWRAVHSRGAIELGYFTEAIAVQHAVIHGEVIHVDWPMAIIFIEPHGGESAAPADVAIYNAAKQMGMIE